MLNKNGFTLIELLAAMVILGIIAVITIPVVTNSLDASKDKNEIVFKSRLSDFIDSYITEYSKNITFSSSVYQTITKGEGVLAYTTSVYESTNTITLNDLVDLNIVSAPIKNPKNKDICSLNTPIIFYKDSDSVYCYKINNMSCLTLDNKSINTCPF